MSLMLYILTIIFIVPLYLLIIHNSKSISLFELLDINIDEKWKARLSLATPVVCLFSPVIVLILLMVYIMVYIAYLKEMWEKSFKEEEDE